jgi:ethanolamine utilization protein EutA
MPHDNDLTHWHDFADDQIHWHEPASNKTSDEAGGSIGFSNIGRCLEKEDEIRLTSVGVDIGSSTSHLVFSRIVLERLDNRYIVSEREVLHKSEVLLTPYAEDLTIDALALGKFINQQYELAKVDPATIDTGALILTGVAVRRSNARAIANLFAAQAGKFVSVSAGDRLETILSAFGSGAAVRSLRDAVRVMNIDVGGGTSKIAVCEAGEVVGLTAVDVGARIVSFDPEGCVSRIEEAGHRFAREVGLELKIGVRPDAHLLSMMVERMAERLFEIVKGGSISAESASLVRLDPLAGGPKPDVITFSGGVSEYIYELQSKAYGDLGPQLAQAILQRIKKWEVRIEKPDQGIMATVVGASQYTIQVSGNTIYVSPLSTLPLNNVPVIAPDLPLGEEILGAEDIAAAVRRALRLFQLDNAEQAIALCYRWQGSATFARLDSFCRGIVAGLSPLLERGLALILIGEGDTGGLIGLHCREELRIPNPIVSIDGITLKDFDFIDIGAMLSTSAAVPVVIKSLIFPTSTALGRVGQKTTV